MSNTYLVDISNINKTWNNFEKRTKYEINKCPEVISETEDYRRFDRLHKLTRPERKIDLDYIGRLYISYLPRIKIYTTSNAMAMVSWDDKRGYYLLAARDKTQNNNGSPSKILWQAMQDLNKIGIKEMDLCGANKPNIILFKRGFGGRLTEQCKPCLTY